MTPGRRRALAVAALALGAGLSAPSAQAQVRGIPAYNSGVFSGLALYGDGGFPNSDAGEGPAYALTGRAGFGAFGATAIFSSFNPDGPPSSDLSVGATLNYKLFGG